MKPLAILVACAIVPLTGCGLLWPKRTKRMMLDMKNQVVEVETSTPMFTEESDSEAEMTPASAPGSMPSFKWKQNMKVSDANYSKTRQSEGEALKKLGEGLIELGKEKIPF